jgi:hypothetical protein
MTTTHTTAASGDSKPERLLHEKPIALRLLPHERAEAFEIAQKQSRSASNLALMVYRAGIQALKSQGAL